MNAPFFLTFSAQNWLQAGYGKVAVFISPKYNAFEYWPHTVHFVTVCKLSGVLFSIISLKLLETGRDFNA